MSKLSRLLADNETRQKIYTMVAACRERCFVKDPDTGQTIEITLSVVEPSQLKEEVF